MDRDIQNMGRASRGEGRREGEGNTNGHSSGAGHEKESRTSQWTVIAGGRGEGARRRGCTGRPAHAAEWSRGAGGGGGGGRSREWPRRSGCKRGPGEGRGGEIKHAHGEREGRKRSGRKRAGRQAAAALARTPPLEKQTRLGEARAGQRGLRGRLAAGCAEEVGELGEAR